jgi:hypothetical protein
VRRITFSAALALCVCAAASPRARAGEEPHKLQKFVDPDRDPVLARIGLTDAQKKRFAELCEDYLAQKAEIEKKYADVQGKGPLAKRGMFREMMQLETGAEPEFMKVLTAAQHRKIKAAEQIEKRYRQGVELVNAELDKRAAWARTNPASYADFKASCDRTIAQMKAERNRLLDSRVGKLPEAPGPGQAKPGKIDLESGGTWKHEKWEYSLRVERDGSRIKSRYGSLTRDGRGLHLEKPGTELDTPWGKMKNLGPAKAGSTDSGWMPVP